MSVWYGAHRSQYALTLQGSAATGNSGAAASKAGWQVSMDIVRVMTEEGSGLLQGGSMMHLVLSPSALSSAPPSQLCFPEWQLI